MASAAPADDGHWALVQAKASQEASMLERM